MTSAIPYDLEAITPGWLSDALQATSPISNVDFERLEEARGFLGEVARLTIEYDATPEEAPRSMIAKLPAANPNARALGCQLRFYEREIRFYDTLAASSPVATPRCSYSALDDDASLYVLLLEDLATARVGDQVVGLDGADLRCAVQHIAAFHAHWWEHSSLGDLSWVPVWNDPAIVAVVQHAYAQALPVFHQHFGDTAPAGINALSERLADRIGEVGDRLAAPPIGLVHGDYRADNLMFPVGEPTGEGDAVTVIDWQIIARGRPAFDVAYLLSQSVCAQLRRELEQEIWGSYHEALCVRGVQDYSLEQCLTDYRTAALYGLVYVVIAATLIGASDRRGVDIINAVTQRVMAAAADLELASLLA